MATTYNNLFLDTRARLRKAGIEAGQLEARELICYAADKSREQFYRDMPLYVSGEMERRVEELVQRRLAGEPVAYIVGEWEFYGLPLNISNDVLIPRVDTEVLAERGDADFRPVSRFLAAVFFEDEARAQAMALRLMLHVRQTYQSIFDRLI